MSGLGVSAATAALYGPSANTTNSAMLLSGLNSALASQGMATQPSGLFQLAHKQQSLQVPSFVSQESMFSRSQDIPADGQLLQQQCGVPMFLGMVGGEYGLAPAEQFPPNNMYQQVHVAGSGAGALGAIGSRLQPMPMQPPMHQMMLVPAGAQDFAGFGGLSLPPPAASSAMGLQGSLLGFL
jgi:hypothetical protein